MFRPKTNSQKTIFFELKTLLKQMKFDLLKHKNSFEKLALKTLEKIRILALKNLVKTNFKWGIYNPHKNSARWQLIR